jgi:hypothetical protein
MPEEPNEEIVDMVKLYDDMEPLVESLESAIEENFPDLITGHNHMMVCFALADTLGRIMAMMLREQPDHYYNTNFPAICNRIHQVAVLTTEKLGEYRH